MSASKSKFELPRTIEHHLATLSKLYGKEGEQQKREIIVNAQVEVVEEISSDNWNGGTYGHALHLTLPEDLYLASAREKEDLQQQIRTDINKIHSVQSEFIEEVFIEMAPIEDQDWRRESGLLHSGMRKIPPATSTRIWGERGFRVFLSHKAEVKKEAAALKEHLGIFGISCFVAHEDIHPTKEWQDEIEAALASMDAFVALMTHDFHDSLWTDQEVGFAVGRGVPILAVKLGRAPYGFIGKFQALTCGWENASTEILRILLHNARMLDSYFAALAACSSWEKGNDLAQILPLIEHLSEAQVQRLIDTYNNHAKLKESWGFNGGYPSQHGQGLRFHLSRITGKSFRRTEDGTLEFP